MHPAVSFKSWHCDLNFQGRWAKGFSLLWVPSLKSLGLSLCLSMINIDFMGSPQHSAPVIISTSTGCFQGLTSVHNLEALTVFSLLKEQLI